METFNLIDGVWVTSHRCAIPVAIALRHSLIELATARQAGEGQQTKMELVYQYLTGPRFRHRIEAIVEKFADMQRRPGQRTQDDDHACGRSAKSRSDASSNPPPACMATCRASPARRLQEIEGLEMQRIELDGEVEEPVAQKPR